HGYLGFSEFDGTPRAGFCLMGACQDCSLWLADGRRIRACMTTVESGMTVASRPPLRHEQ
ncbi:2Fe-2S iron-sulfur cluster-binding protein, partial [Mesorhizobium sp. M7A.F.Ca.ET.027.03.2.1]